MTDYERYPKNLKESERSEEEDFLNEAEKKATHDRIIVGIMLNLTRRGEYRGELNSGYKIFLESWLDGLFKDADAELSPEISLLFSDSTAYPVVERAVLELYEDAAEESKDKEVVVGSPAYYLFEFAQIVNNVRGDSKYLDRFEIRTEQTKVEKGSSLLTDEELGSLGLTREQLVDEYETLPWPKRYYKGKR